MPTLYSIKPKGDGYHTLGRNLIGDFILIDKSTKYVDARGVLTFDTQEEAQKFIDTHNLSEEYEPEKFWRSEKHHEEVQQLIKDIKITPIMYCPDCGHSLRAMCTVGADESASGFSETLYHCENNSCMLDFNVIRDSEGRFVKMTRHFWG